MPGLRGTPAGMMTMSASFNALSAPLSGGRKPVTWAGDAMCERSAATWK